MSAHHSRIETIDQIAKSLDAQNSRDVAKLFGITTDQLDQLRYGAVDTKQQSSSQHEPTHSERPQKNSTKQQPKRAGNSRRRKA
ncbi:hypothetical protein [Corynebacterium diphtheriae]|uniref:hypothetical protein n=1 Tax=Corynebacterium diphtheriae TaxID=1717 RepID=UPI000A1F21E3|nr:hypothetical protein [Corynebacterium diphtheriae]OSQ02507.1 hypothetical protein B1A62_03485 [Corynebacterium diphtheriae]OSQ06393.1 hypothetical protein B1A61_05060 [Corynebacterium diphtheriae]